MSIIPFRGLAQKGILKDPSPYDLEDNAWSGGVNIRFGDTKAERAPIFRTVYDSLPAAPAFVYGRRPGAGYDSVFVAGTDGSVQRYVSKHLYDVSVDGFTALEATEQWTGTYLGDVTYLNRPAGVPLYYGPDSTKFAVLPNWDSTWRCRSLRAFHDYLIALNVTKNGVDNPTLVKWSDLTLDGQVPGSWDHTDSTTNSGENPIAQLDSPIVDGMPLRDAFIIYARNQVWAMSPVPTAEVFTFTRLFSNAGLINVNCVAEVDGVHYCFGPNDIYAHDGTTTRSLVDKRNKRYIFKYLNAKAAGCFFVFYAPGLQEVHFCYQSLDPDVAYTSPTACNRAAVYSIPNDTWSFIDLPNVTAYGLANVDGGWTFDSVADHTPQITCDNVGGTYDDQLDGYQEHLVAVSAQSSGQLTANRLLAYDFMDKGKLPFPYVPETNPDAYIERVGLDLDAEGIDLGTYKTVRRIFPQVAISRDIPLTVRVGGDLTPAGTTTWSAPVSFSPVSQYKVDMRKGGRYLAVRMSASLPSDFEITGFDADVNSSGAR